MIFREDLEYGSEDDEEDEDSQEEGAGDAEEREFDRAAKAELRYRRDLERDGGEDRLFEDSYDSEVEEEFFGRPKPKSKKIKEEDDKGKSEAEKGKEEDQAEKAVQAAGQEIAELPKEPKNTKGLQVYDPEEFTGPLEDVN